MNSTRNILLLVSASLVAVAASAPASTSSTTPFPVHWTAPGDDIGIGRASAYDLRYSNLPLTTANFNLATTVVGLPSPSVAGSPESCVVSGLPDGVLFYIAIKSRDDAGNWSPMSNVITRTGHPTGLDPAVLALSFSTPWPNPTRTGVRWAYSIPEAAPIQVDVFDVTGRHVQTVASGARGAGTGELSWDLRDDRGNPVAAGVYVVKARLGSRGWTNRVVVVR